MSVAGMRMLRWMCGNTRRDKVRNEDIRIKISVASIKEKMRENSLDGLVMCDVDLQIVRQVELINSGQVKRAKGRPKKHEGR